jgi:hypothetical protein
MTRALSQCQSMPLRLLQTKEPPAQNGWLGKRDKNPMPSVKIRIGTRRIVITITTYDGTFVVSIPKLG